MKLVPTLVVVTFDEAGITTATKNGRFIPNRLGLKIY
jgi:hypothetical protein